MGTHMQMSGRYSTLSTLHHAYLGRPAAFSAMRMPTMPTSGGSISRAECLMLAIAALNLGRRRNGDCSVESP